VVRNFNYSIVSIPATRSTQHPIQLISEAVYTKVKRQERGADDSYSTSAEVKNTWTPPYAFLLSY
jgi:hypothetical protein